MEAQEVRWWIAAAVTLPGFPSHPDRIVSHRVIDVMYDLVSVEAFPPL